MKKQDEITYKDIEEEGISHHEKSQRCLKFYLQKDCSIITDLFLGQFRSTLRCTHCGHESVTFEPFWVVSVPLSKDTIDLQECLELFVREETLDGEEMPSCDDCKDRRKSVKWYSFQRWPEILVVHLKRFAPTGSYRAKLTTNIQVPLSQLDLRYDFIITLGRKILIIISAPSPRIPRWSRPRINATASPTIQEHCMEDTTSLPADTLTTQMPGTIITTAAYREWLQTVSLHLRPTFYFSKGFRPNEIKVSGKFEMHRSLYCPLHQTYSSRVMTWASVAESSLWLLQQAWQIFRQT